MDKEIGRRLRELRKAKKLSQETMAQLLHVSVNHYGYVERGERSLSLDKLILLAEMYQVSLDYLVFGKQQDP